MTSTQVILRAGLFICRRWSKKTIKLFFTFILLFISSFSYSQAQFYLIYFADKADSPYSVSHPEEFLSAKSILRREKQAIPVIERDLPVNPQYVDSLITNGIEVKYTSRWFNAALIYADSVDLSIALSFPFILRTDKVSGTMSNAILNNTLELQEELKIAVDYGSSYNQLSMLGIDLMHNDGYSGKGVTIAVVDAGFSNANTLQIFDTLFQSNRVLATFDFPEKEVNVFDDESHGTSVLSVLAGYKEGELIGSAWKANYMLLRTEDGATEKMVEEVYWLLGAEFADSAGADIINSSLGYNTFDNASHDHDYNDLDGSTTIVTRAAEFAFQTGMLVVNSAGNEGTAPWKYLLAPADGPHVLAVGAVTSAGNYYNISSKGPTSDKRIKPDVAAQGMGVRLAGNTGSYTNSSGTSFAAPIISGFAANFWQAYPDLTNQEVFDAIRISGSHAEAPDTLTGYGIPHYYRVFSAVGGILKMDQQVINLFPNPASDILTIKNVTNQPVVISVFNITSEKVIDIDFPYAVSEISFPVTDLPPGMYFISMKVGQENHSGKFFKR